jgi:hypothetical protein
MAIQAPGLEWRSGESMENPVTDQIAQECRQSRAVSRRGPYEFALRGGIAGVGALLLCST